MFMGVGFKVFFEASIANSPVPPSC